MRKNFVVVAALLLVGLTVVGCGPGFGWSTDKDDTPDEASLKKAYVDARTTLLQAAIDSDPMTRSYAMEGIGKSLGINEGGVLLDGLQDEAVVVQFAAAMALGDLAYLPAKSKLIQIIENPQTDQRVVCGAIYALYRMGNDKYAGQLGTILISEFNLGRGTAAMVMGKMGEKSAIGPLKSLLADEQDPGVRFNAIEALARLGDQRSTQFLESYAKAGVYLDLRLPAIPVIAEIRAPRAESILTRLIDSKQPPRIRVAAAGGLGVLGVKNKKGYDYCVGALENPDEMLRKAYGAGRTIKPVQVSSLQRLAALSIGNMKQARGLKVLLPTLQNQDGAVRVAAAVAILEIQAPARSTRKAGAAKPVRRPSQAPGRTVPKSGTKLHTSGGMD
jgi:HEAT repeat protein